MISFYPGPSKVNERIPKFVKDAHKKGILSINHRSEDFIEISKRTIQLLKEKLHIPSGYTIFFTGSATECWEIIAQSLVSKKSHHIFNGAFGQKWYEYTKRIQGGARSYPFQTEEIINVKKFSFNDADSIICITQNETSNGTQIRKEEIKALRQSNPTSLIAVDATSSMGGIELDFKLADIWFASVQKCLGLPAGLGLMVCSEEAINSAIRINEDRHYNSITFMKLMMDKFQTPFTPNVLGIYLLMRVMDESDDISEIHTKTEKRYLKWVEFLADRKLISHFVKNKQAHSYTVIPVHSEEEMIERIKAKAKKNDILLGEGYGEFKPTTFRIANFPALRKSEINVLKEFLADY